MSSFTLIAAALADTNGIGFQNDLPWRLPNEMRYFQRVTTWLGRRDGSAYPSQEQQQQQKENGKDSAEDAPWNAVIMGRKTWDSMPDGFRPLKNRINIVLTSDQALIPSIERNSSTTPIRAFTSLAAALSYLQIASPTHTFIIGGSHLYSTCITHPLCNRILLTRVVPPKAIECDTFFPEIPGDVFERAGEEEMNEVLGRGRPESKQSEKGFEYEFRMWTRRQLRGQNR